MPIEFDVTLTSKDMYRFNLYQTYSGFHGWFSVIIAVVVFFAAGMTYGDIPASYTVLYIAFGVIFLFYFPVTLYLRSKHSLAVSEVLRKPLHYSVGEEGFTVSQGEESAVLPWKQIYKMVATKNNVLVYSGRINAYVIPREQLGDQYEPLAEIAGLKLEKFRINMKK